MLPLGHGREWPAEEVLRLDTVPVVLLLQCSSDSCLCPSFFLPFFHICILTNKGRIMDPPRPSDGQYISPRQHWTAGNQIWGNDFLWPWKPAVLVLPQNIFLSINTTVLIVPAHGFDSAFALLLFCLPEPLHGFGRKNAWPKPAVLQCNHFLLGAVWLAKNWLCVEFCLAFGSAVCKKSLFLFWL